MKSSLADVVKIPSPALRAGAFSIRSEGPAMAEAAPDLHDAFEILAPWFAQSYSESAEQQP